MISIGYRQLSIILKQFQNSLQQTIKIFFMVWIGLAAFEIVFVCLVVRIQAGHQGGNGIVLFTLAVVKFNHRFQGILVWSLGPVIRDFLGLGKGCSGLQLHVCGVYCGH